MTQPVQIALRPLFELQAEVGEVTSIGRTPLGEVRQVQILSGSFKGEELSGELLAGGADWQQVRSDATLEIRARYLLKTDQGELIQVQSEGVRAASAEVLARLERGEMPDSSEYYFRTALRFTTAAPRLLRLNNVLGVSYGRRAPRAVMLSFFEVT
jgi:hypothetical protein